MVFLNEKGAFPLKTCLLRTFEIQVFSKLCSKRNKNLFQLLVMSSTIEKGFTEKAS